MLTQNFRDSEAAQCHLLPLIASTYIHSSVRSPAYSFYAPFTLIFAVTGVSFSVQFRITVWYQ